MKMLITDFQKRKEKGGGLFCAPGGWPVSRWGPELLMSGRCQGVETQGSSRAGSWTQNKNGCLLPTPLWGDRGGCWEGGGAYCKKTCRLCPQKGEQRNWGTCPGVAWRAHSLPSSKARNPSQQASWPRPVHRHLPVPEALFLLQFRTMGCPWLSSALKVCIRVSEVLRNHSINT